MEVDDRRNQAAGIQHPEEGTDTVAGHPILARVVGKVLRHFRSQEQESVSFLSNTVVQEGVARSERKGFEHSSVVEAGKDRLRREDIENKFHAGRDFISKRNKMQELGGVHPVEGTG